MRNVILADKAGFCFGVKRAVETAINKREKSNKPIYTLGPLIHNNDVVELLSSKEIEAIEVDGIESLNKGDIIVIRSHGVSAKILDKLKDKNLIIVNATCPYVSHIQQKAKEYYEMGYGIVIVGDENHPEVIGINGWCENKAVISKDGDDIKNLPAKVCIVSQTTERQENFQKVINSVVKQCKEIVAFNTICSATEVRQKSAEELSKNVDTMIVIGGSHSSNTTKLYEICKNNCSNTVLVENAETIPVELFTNSKNIGVTAGASTPDWIIKEAIKKMSDSKNLEINEQLAYMNEYDVQIAVGDLAKGEVISVGEKEIFINIGYKTDAIMTLKEVTRDEAASMKDLFKVGDEVEAKVISIRNDDGYVVLSKIEIEREEANIEIKNAFENNTTLNIEIKEVVKGGFIGRYKGVRVFIPASQMELNRIKSPESYIGKVIEISIIEYRADRRGTKIVGSRKQMLLSEKNEKDGKAWDDLQKGQVVEGKVRRLTNFGAFVEVNGIDGLLHVSEISWGRVNNPSDVLKVDEDIKVLVLEADKENKKLSLSIKKLTPNPWDNIEEKYPIGNIVLGKVARFTDFGAFIELEIGIDGLAHISEISYKRINKPSDILNLGEEVKAKIINLDKENKKISLSIKEAE